MTTSTPASALPDNCWSVIGISGDRSCPELAEHIHCRNCPVFSAAAKRFFDRPAPAGYLDECTRLLAPTPTPTERDDLSVLVFRLGGEWLALRIRAVVEVTTLRPVHRIPHRSNRILVGMVNLRGQLQLMVSLHGLLGVEGEEAALEAAPAGLTGTARRLVVARHEGRTWVFAADAVAGVQRLARTAFGAVPSNLANPAYSFSQAVIAWDGHSVGFLDEQRLFAALKGAGQ